MKQLVIRLTLTVLCLLSLNAQATEELATIEMRNLTQHIAHKMVLAAVADCTLKGYKVSAAVVDRHGNLAAFLRNPLSGPHTIKVSQRKAFSSATLQAPTSAMAARTDLNFAPDILLIIGGVPISFGGHFYGGIAVAGAEPEEDERCAEAGIAAVADIMDFAD